jgi:glutaminase
VHTHLVQESSHAVLQPLRSKSSNWDICVDDVVAASEAEAGNRNYALAHFMKSCKNLNNPVDSVLQAYFRLCVIKISCVDLARAGLLLARLGTDVKCHQF